MKRKMCRRLLMVSAILILFLASIPANAQLCCEDMCNWDKTSCDAGVEAWYNGCIAGCAEYPLFLRLECESQCATWKYIYLGACYAMFQDCMNGCPCYHDGVCRPECDETTANCPSDCPCDNDGVCEPGQGENSGNCSDCYCEGYCQNEYDNCMYALSQICGCMLPEWVDQTCWNYCYSFYGDCWGVYDECMQYCE